MVNNPFAGAITNSGLGSSNGFFGSGGGLPSGLGGALGSLGSALSFQNPADAASPYLSQIPSALNPYFQPYINAGQQQLPGLESQYGQLTGGLNNLQSQYQNLTNNPGQQLNQIGSSYQQSPGYQFQVQQATNAAQRQGAATGMQGSPEQQQNLANTVGGLANQDYYNYLGNALNLYGSGLQGQQGLYNQGLQGQQGLYQSGQNAAQEYGTDIGNALGAQAQNAYAGANAANQNNRGLFGSLGSLAGLASFL